MLLVPGMVVKTFNPGNWKAKAGISVSSRPAKATQWEPVSEQMLFLKTRYWRGCFPCLHYKHVSNRRNRSPFQQFSPPRLHGCRVLIYYRNTWCTWGDRNSQRARQMDQLRKVPVLRKDFTVPVHLITVFRRVLCYNLSWVARFNPPHTSKTKVGRNLQQILVSVFYKNWWSNGSRYPSPDI